MARVEIELIPWRDDHRVEQADAFILVGGTIAEVDGQLLLERQVRIELDGFLTVTGSPVAWCCQ